MKKIILYCVLFFLLGCASQTPERLIKNIEIKLVDNELYSRYLTLNEKDGFLTGVYSDEKTVSLKHLALQGDTILSGYIDKIDTDAKLNSLLGYHGYLVTGKSEYVFYLDYENEKRNNFKIATRDSTADNWKVYPQKISSPCFSAFLMGDQMGLIYFEEELLIDFIVKNNLTYTPQSLLKDKKIKALKTVTLIEKKMLKVAYLDDENNLFLMDIVLDGNSIKNNIQKKIDSGVKNFDIEKSNESYIGLIYYKDKDYAYNYYNESSNQTDTIGYFMDIHGISLFYYNNNPLFLYSSIKESNIKKQENDTTGDAAIKENSEQVKYNLSIIYNADFTGKKKRWMEEEILNSETPVISLDSHVTGKEINILAGGNAINLISIPVENFKGQE